MRAERLFRALGLADPALVEEALAVRARRVEWKRWAALAACLALVLGFAVSGGFRGDGGMAPGGTNAGSSGGAMDGADGGGDGSGGAEGGIAFLSYAGPVLPLDTLENPAELTAERTVTWDFAPGAYPDGERRQWGAEVTDAYILRNGTEEDLAVTALYPFAGSFAELALPAVTVGGEAVEPALYAGAYAGGLLEHSLNVYYRLVRRNTGINVDTLTVAALLHDVCKIHLYEKQDGGGYHHNERFPIGHGEKSVILILRHMPLTDEEITAISWHMGAFDSRAGAGRSLSQAWEKCPLALHLHLADMEATWFDEKRGPQK